MQLTALLFVGAAVAFPGMGGVVKRNGLAAAELPRAVNVAAAKTSSAASSYPTWQAPGPNDVRSPCPGLNALANHNICPRNGRGYTIPALTDCLARGMNMGADFSLFVGTAGIGSNPNPLLGHFDLDMLD